MALPVPSPSTAVAGGKILASEWNAAVRDAVNYLVELQGGVGRRNSLTNSHFDIWQSGTTAAIPTGGTGIYLADQWVAYRNAAGATVSQQTGPTGQKYKLRVQRNAGNASTSPLKICQPIETRDSLRFAGQSASLRLSLAAGSNFSPAASQVTVRVEYGTGTDQNPVSGFSGSTDALTATQAITTTLTDYTFDNIVIPTNATQLAVWVEWTPVGTAGANDFVDLAAAQLSVGSAAGFERLPIGQTLAECQRYYCTGGAYFDGQVTNGVRFSTVAYFPDTMRTTPGITQTNASNVSFGAAAGQQNQTADGFSSQRIATSTAAGLFTESFTASARL